MRTVLTTFLMSLLALSFVPDANALTPPKVGRQYLTAGLTLQPGLLADSTLPDEPAFNSPSFAAATMVRLGLQHVVAPVLYMALEVELGSQWLNEHGASSTGRADSEMAFAWQIALVGRFVPGADTGGIHMGLGVQWFNAWLDDAPLQVLGVDLRTGIYLWEGNDEFALLELGYVLPFISGLDFPTDFTGMAEAPAEQDWTFHRFLISFNYGW